MKCIFNDIYMSLSVWWLSVGRYLKNVETAEPIRHTFFVAPNAPIKQKNRNTCLFDAEFDEKSISEKLKLLPERGPRIACVYATFSLASQPVTLERCNIRFYIEEVAIPYINSFNTGYGFLQVVV